MRAWSLFTTYCILLFLVQKCKWKSYAWLLFLFFLLCMVKRYLLLYTFTKWDTLHIVEIENPNFDRLIILTKSALDYQNVDRSHQRARAYTTSTTLYILYVWFNNKLLFCYSLKHMRMLKLYCLFDFGIQTAKQLRKLLFRSISISMLKLYFFWLFSSISMNMIDYWLYTFNELCWCFSYFTHFRISYMNLSMN